MRNLLLSRYLCTLSGALLAILCVSGHTFATEPPEYLASFNPAKGFAPAQRDLTEVFLQIAGSLENFGSPEPYLRHMAKEHARIEALYTQKTGRAPQSFRPAHMTDTYIDRLTANWKLLAPKLGLEPYAKDVGHMMRDAIKGTRGTGTIIVEIFNRHQANVLAEMSGKNSRPANFEALRLELVERLELKKAVVDENGYEISRRDAVSFALGIQGVTLKLFKRLDESLKPADAEKIKAVLTSIFIDVGQMAQSELQAGISEWAARNLSGTPK
jgi:hypothetical protein